MKSPEHLAAEYASKQHSDTHCKVSYGEKSARRGGVYTSIEQAFLAGYQAAAPQWISVKDRLPDISKRMSDRVLILDCYGVMSVKPFEKYGKEIGVDWGEAGLRPLSDFTHWMPLPEAPK